MCPYTPRSRLTVEPRLTSARRARDFLRQHACPRHAGAVLDVALLLVSELVTNAVRHGRPPIEVEVECQGSHGLAVHVSDGGSGSPTVIDLTPDADAEGGRGLAIVETLADSWGVSPSGRGGKSVWFRLDPRRVLGVEGGLHSSANA